MVKSGIPILVEDGKKPSVDMVEADKPTLDAYLLNLERDAGYRGFYQLVRLLLLRLQNTSNSMSEGIEVAMRLLTELEEQVCKLEIDPGSKADLYLGVDGLVLSEALDKDEAAYKNRDWARAHVKAVLANAKL